MLTVSVVILENSFIRFVKMFKHDSGYRSFLTLIYMFCDLHSAGNVVDRNCYIFVISATFIMLLLPFLKG